MEYNSVDIQWYTVDSPRDILQPRVKWEYRVNWPWIIVSWSWVVNGQDTMQRTIQNGDIYPIYELIAAKSFRGKSSNHRFWEALRCVGCAVGVEQPYDSCKCGNISPLIKWTCTAKYHEIPLDHSWYESTWTQTMFHWGNHHEETNRNHWLNPRCGGDYTHTLKGKSPLWWLIPTCLLVQSHFDGWFIWLVVDLPLWKIWISWDDDIPSWIENHKSHVPNHQSVLADG